MQENIAWEIIEVVYVSGRLAFLLMHFFDKSVKEYIWSGESRKANVKETYIAEIIYQGQRSE